VQSYAGSMDFGLTACRRAMPQSELYALVKDMKAAYAELEALPPSALGAPATAAMRSAGEAAAPARAH
jgi:diacylglycerol O-acyltransferase / wax synthase